MKNKITIKLILIIVISTTLLACIMAPIYFYLQPKMYINQEINNVEEFSDELKAVEPFDEEHLDEFVSNSPESYRIYVFDKDFKPLYTSYEFGNNNKFLKQLFSKKLNDFHEDSEAYYTEIDNDPSVRLSTCCEKNGKTYYIYKRQPQWCCFCVRLFEQSFRIRSTRIHHNLFNCPLSCNVSIG